MKPVDHADVTVAVATVDRPDALARCLDAILNGEVRPREILVVDQGDSERTRMIANERDGHQTRVLHLRQVRRGLAASRNVALRTARYPVLATTDDDCVPGHGWVAALSRALSEAEPPQAVTGPMLPLGDQPGAYAVSSRTSMDRAEYRGFHLPWLVGTGGNISVHRDFALAVGGYDERLGIGSAGCAGEDLDLIYRLLRAGAVVRYEPNALVYHELQSKDRRRDTRSTYGRGVGSCCGLWLRNGDPKALAILGRWVVMRGTLLATAAVGGDSERVREELLVLGGTARGLAYGFKGASAPRAASQRKRKR
jgi:GT2 family glycosyltransferase